MFVCFSCSYYLVSLSFTSFVHVYYLHHSKPSHNYCYSYLLYCSFIYHYGHTLLAVYLLLSLLFHISILRFSAIDWTTGHSIAECSPKMLAVAAALYYLLFQFSFCCESCLILAVSLFVYFCFFASAVLYHPKSVSFSKSDNLFVCLLLLLFSFHFIFSSQFSRSSDFVKRSCSKQRGDGFSTYQRKKDVIQSKSRIVASMHVCI